ncbi:NACHT domain-containing protein [Micromonospora sp. NPDC005254]|uniref:NACHT N-terminal Helical domain 1-containing protein n=1 Tax=Micromonospora sp. NPDC005254 TaxID=3364229 RepID=UPI003682020F
MSTVALTLVGLGASVVKNATKLWLGDKAIAADVSVDAVDAISSRLSDVLQERKLRRTFDRLADTVADKLTAFVSREFHDLAENEKAAALQAVQDTLERSPLKDYDLFEHDLNAAYVDKYLRRQFPQAKDLAGLSEPARALYDIVLRDCCEYIVQVSITLPQFQSNALTEILRRESDIAETLQDALARLPERSARGIVDFEVDYRRQVANSLDRLELFGARLEDASRRYPLSVAYISLSVTSELSNGEELPAAGAEPTDTIKVNQLLSSSRRVLLRGGAGGGKTTLLRWISVRAALKDFPDELSSWNQLVPFFIPLRTYVDQQLPLPGQFVDHVGRHIREEMPNGWVQSLMRAGHAVVLVDGVDELPEHQRETAREWLESLVETFPGALYIITSRPGAAAPDWLDGASFKSYELQPMTPYDVHAFVRHWHEAIRNANPDVSEKEALLEYESLLLNRIRNRGHLRSLAETPLLCALICALHYDRRGQLPTNRMELYDVALEMLLERRDAERRLAADLTLSRTDKVLLLQDISYWFIRNGWSDAERDRVIQKIREKLPQMPQIKAAPDRVYKHLLERSGLLREPLVGRVDFVHRTFQEYLAALGALAADDVGALIANAHRDQWREVVVMAAGHAHARERRELLQGILDRKDTDTKRRDHLSLLAVACLETSPELDPKVRRQIQQRAEEVLPPRSITAAKVIASAGDFATDLLARTRPRLAKEVAATIRAAADIGTDGSLSIIQRYGKDRRATVVRELLLAWPRFDVITYAATVLAHNPLHNGFLYIDDPSLVPALKYLKHLNRLRLSAVPRPASATFVGDLPNLNELWLRAPTDGDLGPLGKATHLSSLHLLNPLETSIRRLTPLPNLRSVGIYQPMSEISWPDIQFAPNATAVTVESAKMVAMIDVADSFPNVQTLSLSGCMIHNFDGIQRMKNLKALDLSQAIIEDPSALRSLEGIRVLDVTDTKAEGLEEIGHHLGMDFQRIPTGHYTSLHYYPGITVYFPRWVYFNRPDRSVWYRRGR